MLIRMTWDITWLSVFAIVSFLSIGTFKEKCQMLSDFCNVLRKLHDNLVEETVVEEEEEEEEEEKIQTKVMRVCISPICKPTKEAVWGIYWLYCNDNFAELMFTRKTAEEAKRFCLTYGFEYTGIRDVQP